MYQIIDNPRIMLKDEIEKEYDRRWVYIVNAEFAIGKRFVKGMPVIVADFPFEGQEDGIYDKYRTPEYDSRYARDLCHYEPSIPSVFAVEFV
jgi:hypothetical protein